jgi:hypothetical protein
MSLDPGTPTCMGRNAKVCRIHERATSHIESDLRQTFGTTEVEEHLTTANQPDSARVIVFELEGYLLPSIFQLKYVIEELAQPTCLRRST